MERRRPTPSDRECRVTAIRISPRPGLFSINDYPNTTPGDDATGLRAAIDACYTAGGGVVQLEKGVYNLRSRDPASGGKNAAFLNRVNSGVSIEVRGRGPFATTLKPVSPVAYLLAADVDSQTSIPTLWPVSLYDFTLDCTSIGSAPFNAMLVMYTSGPSSFGFSTTGFHRIERVNIDKAGHSVGQARTCVTWNPIRASIADANSKPTCVLRGLRVRGCDWGHYGGDSITRGAGSTAFAIGGWVTTTGGPVDKNTLGQYRANRLYNGLYGTQNSPSNVDIDDMLVEDTKWTTGSTPIVGSGIVSSFIGSGAESHLKYIHVRDCQWENSGDVGLELDGSMEHILIEGCIGYNSDGVDYLFVPWGTHPGHSNDGTEVIVRGCQSIRPSVDKYGSVATNSSNSAAFAHGSLWGLSSENTRFLYEDCHVKLLGQRGSQAAGAQFHVGPARETIIRNCRVTLEPTATRITGDNGVIGVRITATGCPQRVKIEDFRIDMNAPTSAAVIDNAVLLGSVHDLDLQIDGIRLNSYGAETGGGSRNVRTIVLNSVGTEAEETWTTDTIEMGNVFLSPTLYTDYTWNASHYYLPNTALSTEKRAMYVCTSTSGFDSGATVGKVTDGAFWCQFTPGTTLTGYKAGTFSRLSVDRLSYLEAYVCDNGTNSFLCVDKVVAGTRTSLLSNGVAVPGAQASTTWTTVTPATITSPPAGTSGVGLQLSTRLATGTAHYESLIVQGDVLIAEHSQSAKPGKAATRMGGSGDAFLSVSLTTRADIAAVGSRTFGEVGWSHTPISSDARLGNMYHRQFTVLKGNMRDVIIESLGATSALPSAVSILPRSGATTTGGVAGTPMAPMRIDGSFDIERCDFSKQLGSGNATVRDYDFDANIPMIAQYVRRRGNRLSAANAADAAIAFTSATAWQNTSGHWGSVTIQGGTVSKIEISKDNSTFRDTGVTSGSFRIIPNWWVKVTHTGAPTAAFVAED